MTGFRSILLRSRPSDRDELITELWQHGTVGIIEEANGMRAFFEESDSLAGMLAIFAARTIETRIEVLSDASEFPKQDWDPILVGKRFWIAPSWVDKVTPPGRIRLAIDNSNAFGSGRHESTQLVLEALERHVNASVTVLDIGSGSGILSQAALLLGAQAVFSCDIHPDAIASSKVQLAPRLFVGSADGIRSQTGDIVVANISAKVVDGLAWELNRITKPNGLMLLSGFIREHPPRRFSPEKITELGDWACWLCRPLAASSADDRAPEAHSLQWW